MVVQRKRVSFFLIIVLFKIVSIVRFVVLLLNKKDFQVMCWIFLKKGDFKEWY